MLIINEDITIINNITEELAKRNFDVIGVGNIEEAKKALERRQFDLIILDAKINSINGIGLLKELHADPRFKWTSKFLLIADASYSDIIETLKAGADDYITKPFNMDELITRIEIRIMRMEELHGISVRDPLTGVFTRDYFSERLAEERERFSRQEKPFSVVMCDLDFFKSVNDEHGHQVGDFVLQSFASFLYKQLRRSDTVGRYGGEEFIVLLPETDALTAYKVMERLRSAWEEKKLLVEPDKNKSIEITFSAGISEFDKDGNTEAEIIKAADDALYQAKENGRNKVVVRASHSGEGDFPLLPKILVVDDSPLIRSMLLNELKKDFTIFLAKDGEDALLQLQRVKPHVVLADIIMPIMDGLELTKRIREDPYNKNVKIIAMTSDAKKITVLEAFQAGVDDFVSKPFDNQELEARILRLLRKRSER